MPKISILIVVYNCEDLIEACLYSLEMQVYQDFEIIIVDNKSSDNSLTNIYRSLKSSPIAPKTKIISLNNNLGFAGGNNEAFRYAVGEYISLINPDAEASSGWLKELVTVMDSHPEIGICASNLVVYGQNIIDSTGDECSTTGVGFKRGEGELSVNNQNLEYVFGACGGAVMYRRKMLEEIGFFDDDFFIIHEDSDLNFRAQLAGWKCLYVPKAVVYHKVSSIIGKMSEVMVYYSVRNSLYVYMKNMPAKLMIRYFHHKMLQEVGALLYFMRHGKLKSYSKAYFDFLSILPLVRKKRNEIQKLKKVSDQYLKSVMIPLVSRKLFKKQVEKLFKS